ncbi:MAG: DUF58 domain-containing protein [Victivallales bacterium]|nr:DUF58 domain-containing protein [Victivallales bacterium]
MPDNNKSSLIDPDVMAGLSRLSLRARGLVEGSFSGMHKSPHRGSSVEFSQYRKYVPGDDISNLDWRVYARSDRFYIKEFDADTNLRCHLVVDCSGSMGFTTAEGKSKLDYAKKTAATLAQILVQQGDAVGLQCFSEGLHNDIPAHGGARHLGNIFSVLAGIRSGGGTRIINVLHDLAEKIRRRAMIIVFSDLFTEVEPLLDCFQHMRFRKHDLIVFHLLSKAERSFEFDRSIRFLDMEKSFSMVTEPAMVRQDYLREFNSYLAQMKDGCREFHVDYRAVDIERKYDKVLAEFMLERQK